MTEPEASTTSCSLSFAPRGCGLPGSWAGSFLPRASSISFHLGKEHSEEAPRAWAGSRQLPSSLGHLNVALKVAAEAGRGGDVPESGAGNPALNELLVSGGMWHCVSGFLWAQSSFCAWKSCPDTRAGGHVPELAGLGGPR